MVRWSRPCVRPCVPAERAVGRREEGHAAKLSYHEVCEAALLEEVRAEAGAAHSHKIRDRESVPRHVRYERGAAVSSEQAQAGG
jgi:hypothetical protein